MTETCVKVIFAYFCITIFSCTWRLYSLFLTAHCVTNKIPRQTEIFKSEDTEDKKETKDKVHTTLH